MREARVFKHNSENAPPMEDKTFDMLLCAGVITFYQTILFNWGKRVDYYVFTTDRRAFDAQPLDDRR